MAVSTEELIRRYQAGQTDLFEPLFERYKDYVFRVAYGLMQQAEDAEEVVQETFLDVLKALPRYDVGGPARFETWLYQVTANRCKMRWRRKQLPCVEWDEIGERLAGGSDSASDRCLEDVAERHDTRRRVWQAVGRLKDIYREVIMLRYGHDLSYEEIARALDLNIGTVKSRLNAAHRQLQETMGGGGAGEQGTARAKRAKVVLPLLRIWALVRCWLSERRCPAWVKESIAHLVAAWSNRCWAGGLCV